MKRISIILILSIVVGALFCTCSKDKLSPLEQLPPITSRGANTFGCLINGEPVVFTNPKQITGGFLYNSDSVFGLFPMDSNDIWLFFENGKNSVNLFVKKPYYRSEWSLDKRTQPFPYENDPKDYLMINGFISSQFTSGWIKCNDFKNSYPIFSATFEFECINSKSCDKMKVTNGRLDVNLHDIE